MDDRDYFQDEKDLAKAMNKEGCFWVLAGTAVGGLIILAIILAPLF